MDELNPRIQDETENLDGDDIPDWEKDELDAAEKLYAEIAKREPQRNVNVPVVATQSKSFDEAESSGGNDTDYEKFLKRLFPNFPIKKLKTVCQSVMVGRVLYDSMLDRVNLTVTSIVDTWDSRPIEQGGDGRLDFQLILDCVTVAYEIGLDSKGRVDAIEGLGASESKQLNDIANQIAG